MPRDWRKAVEAAVVSIFGVTAFIVAVDLLFGRHEQIAPIVPHLRYMIPRAAFEELAYRLVLMTLIVWAGTWRTGTAPRWYFWGAIILSQFVNVGILEAVDPLYSTFRYWAVGCVWGWLFWRHGWVTALGAHMACHLVLDPLLLVMPR